MVRWPIPSHIGEKITLITEQLGVRDLGGFRTDRWPSTAIPALNLAAAGYEIDPATGLAVSLSLRSLVFEQGRDVSDSDVLAEVAGSFGLAVPGTDPLDAVLTTTRMASAWECVARRISSSAMTSLSALR